MTTLLVLVLLFSLLLGLAAASSPSMEPSMSVGPMQSFYPDPDGMLEAICELCGISINYCAHAMTLSRRAPTFTESTFLNHPDWPRDDPLDVLPDYEIPALQPSYFEYDRRPPLLDDVVRQLDYNATTIQPSTIQAYIDEIYLPGDHIAAASGSRRTCNRRQTPRLGGFPCAHDTCEKVFNRSCDLKRHEKTHLDRSERPHKCAVCNEGFLYPKDRNRHQRTHDHSSSPNDLLYCTFRGCDNAGFSRRDNLLRHQRRQHPQLFPRSS